MANSKISDYSSLTGTNVDPAADVLEIVDTSVTTNKKVTVEELGSAISRNPIGTNQTLTDGATVNWDTDLGVVGTLTLGGNRTMAAPTNMNVGTLVLVVIQDGTGTRTITWNAVFKWSGGVAPVLSTTASAKDVISFFTDGTNLYGSLVIRGAA